MSQKLPIAIVIPHAGLETPPELVERVQLTEQDIFNEADVYTELVYDFSDRVLHWHTFPYARCIIDVNRSLNASPSPHAGDGIVKRITSYGTNVYTDETAPDDALEQHLINTYWRSWHESMATIAADSEVKLVLDCHSMAAITPSNWGEAVARPRISVCNSGATDGTPRAEDLPITAPPDLTRSIGQAFGDALADIPDLAPTSAPYTLNTPFTGGPTIRLNSSARQPWLMVELSRATYIGLQTENSPVVPPDMARIEVIRENLWQAIEAIVAQL